MRGVSRYLDRDMLRRIRDPLYNEQERLIESLYAKIEEKYGAATMDNIILGVQEGVGEEEILELQRIAQDDARRRDLGERLPNSIFEVIKNYQPKNSPKK